MEIAANGQRQGAVTSYGGRALAVVLAAAVVAGQSSDTVDLSCPAASWSHGSFDYTTEVASDISLGYSHACFLSAGDQPVRCRGICDAGIGGPCLGENRTATTDASVSTTSPSGRPTISQGDTVDLPPQTGQPAKLATGAFHTCVATNASKVFCWGSNIYGNIGIASPISSVPSPGEEVKLSGTILDVYMLAAGLHHTCALVNASRGLVANAEVQCWGSNDAQQCGVDLTPPNGGFVVGNKASLAMVVVNFGGFSYVPVYLACGAFHCCAIMSTRSTVRCWGSSVYYQAGTTNSVQTPTTPISMPNSTWRYSQIACGPAHTCLLAVTGQVVCMGSNARGESVPGGSARVMPTRVAVTPSTAGPQPISIAASASVTCVVMGDSVASVRCWGAGAAFLSSAYGQAWATAPAGVHTLPPIYSSASPPHRVTAIQGSSVWMHADSFAQTPGPMSPTQSMLDDSPLNALADTDTPRMCFQLSDQRWICSGHVSNGHALLARVSQPLRVGGRTRFITPADLQTWPNPSEKLREVIPSTSAACARVTSTLTGKDRVYCWGDNSASMLCTGDAAPRDAPSTLDAYAVPLAARDSVAALALGGSHACARNASGTVICWGASGAGQTGYGINASVCSSPALMPQVLGVVPLGASTFTNYSATFIVAGGDNTCVVLDDLRVVCFGENANNQFALLNDTLRRIGASASTALPVAGTVPTTSTPVIAACVNVVHGCFVTTAGLVRCFGLNNRGQTGTAAYSGVAFSDDAALVSVGCAVSDIACGEAHTAAICTDGSVRTWGSNAAGQLGRGHDKDVGSSDVPAANPPVPIGGGFSATKVTAGKAHTCVLGSFASVSAPSLICWGDSRALPATPPPSSITAATQHQYAWPTVVNIPGLPAGAQITSLRAASNGFTTCVTLNTYQFVCFGDSFGANTTAWNGSLSTPTSAVNVVGFASSPSLAQLMYLQHSNVTSAQRIQPACYPAPFAQVSIASAAPAIIERGGPTQISIRGLGFVSSGLGTAGGIANASIGGIQCLNAWVVSDTQLECVAPDPSAVAKQSNLDASFPAAITLTFPPALAQAPPVQLFLRPTGSSAPAPAILDVKAYTKRTDGILSWDGGDTIVILGQYLGGLRRLGGSANGVQINLKWPAGTAGRTVATCAMTAFSPPAVGSPSGATDQINCTTSAGGVGARIFVELAGGSITGLTSIDLPATTRLTFESPVVLGISPSLGPTDGGQLVTISGARFGDMNVATLQAILIGTSVCASAVVVSSTTITCFTPPGTGLDWPVVIQIAGQNSTFANNTAEAVVKYAYRAPIVSGISPAYVVVPANGSLNFTLDIRGLYFGPVTAKQPAVTLGRFPCSAPRMDSTRLMCTDLDAGQMAAALGGNVSDPTAAFNFPLELSVTVDGQNTSLSDAFRIVGAPNITRISPDIVTPGAFFTIDGDNLAEVTAIIVGGAPCTQARRVDANKAACDGAPELSGFDHDVIVFSAGGRRSARSDVARISYQVGAPQVMNVSPDHGPTVGGNVVTISGVNLIPNDRNVQIRMGTGSCIVIPPATSSSVRCRVSAGRGIVPIAVSAGGGVMVNAAFQYTFDAPLVAAILDVPSDGLSTRGGEVINIYGRNFGAEGTYTAATASLVELTATIDVRPCQTLTVAVLWWNSTYGPGLLPVFSNGDANYTERLSCTTPAGIGASLSVSVGVAQHMTITQAAVSYAAPAVTSVGGNLAGITGTSDAQLFGSGFGTVASDVSAWIGPYACAQTVWRSDNELACRLPRGVGSGLTVRVVVGGQTSATSATYSFAPPVITQILPAYVHIPPAGQDYTIDFTLAGTNLANDPADIGQLVIAGVVCPAAAMRNVTPEAVSCVGVSATSIAGTAGSMGSVTIATGGQVMTLNNALRFVGAPSITSFAPMVGNPNDTVVIEGSSLGENLGDILSLSLGGTPCARVGWHSQVSVECVVPDRAGLYLPITLVTRSGVATAPQRFSILAGSDIPPRPVVVAANRTAGVDSTIVLRWSVNMTSNMLPLTSCRVCLHAFNDSSASWVENRCEDLAGVNLNAIDVVNGSTVYERRLADLTPAPYRVNVSCTSVRGTSASSGMTPPVPVSCADTTFLQTHLPLNKWSCAPCPTGALCRARGTYEITALQGYWRGGLDGAGVPVFIACEVADACPAEAVSPLIHNNDTAMTSPAGAESAQSTCATGFRGRLCQSCDEGYARQRNGQCSRCKSQMVILLALVGGILALVVVCAIIISMTIKSKGRMSRPEIALSKILFTHIQTISLAAGFKLPWPEIATGLFQSFDVASSVSDDIISVDCLFSRENVHTAFGNSMFFARTLLMLSTPFAAALLLGFYWLVVSRVYRCRHKNTDFMLRKDASLDAVARAGRESISGRGSITETGAAACKSTPPTEHLELDVRKEVPSALPAPAGLQGSSKTTAWPTAELVKAPGALPSEGANDAPRISVRQFYFDRFLVSMVTTTFLIHMTLTKSSLSSISCRTLSNDIAGSYLVADLSIECNLPSTAAWMYGMGLPAFVLYALGIPLGAFWLLRSMKKDLRLPHVREQYGFLYAGFKPKYYYWEVVIALRKVALAIVSVLVSPAGAVVQTVSGVVVVTLSLMLHSQAHPYNMRMLNITEQAALFTAFMTLIGGQYIYALDSSSRYLAAFLIVVVNGALLAWFVYGFWIVFVRRGTLIIDDGTGKKTTLGSMMKRTGETAGSASNTGAVGRVVLALAGRASGGSYAGVEADKAVPSTPGRRSTMPRRTASELDEVSAVLRAELREEADELDAEQNALGGSPPPLMRQFSADRRPPLPSPPAAPAPPGHSRGNGLTPGSDGEMQYMNPMHGLGNTDVRA